MINLREIILGALMDIVEEEQYSHIVLKDVLEKYQYLDKRDRAFITRVTEGTLENMLQMDYIIERFSKVKVENMKPVIRNILRMSVYQLKYMDSVPDSAVCNEGVRLAQKRGFYQLKGFVNGVLRSVARNLDSLGGRVGIITTDHDGIANEERKARTEGFDGKIFSVVPADMMVGEVFGGDGVDERLADVCMRMNDEDRIDCVVLGCTGMQQAVARLRERLSSALCPVAVVEPLAAGVTHLERSVALGLTNSLHIGLTLEGLVK